MTDRVLTPDLDMAEKFLQMLDQCKKFTFQTYTDTDQKPSKDTLARVLHGTLEEHAATLTRLNQQGAGVAVMVNEGDLAGRSNKNIIRVRALFVDLDGAPLVPVQAAKPAPSIIVETSPERWHCYWLVDGCPLDIFTDCQKALIQKFNSDPKVKELCRVMRMPGFFHHKSETPFKSRLIHPQEEK